MREMSEVKAYLDILLQVFSRFFSLAIKIQEKHASSLAIFSCFVFEKVFKVFGLPPFTILS